MIVIVDYGYGNIFSVKSALNKVGYNCIFSAKRSIIENAKIIILPGVGAYQQAMKALKKNQLDQSIQDAIKKGAGIIGICLGYQMFFEYSEENGIHEGLNLIKGNVLSLKKINSNFKRVPNIGWRKLIPNKKNIFFNDFNTNNYVYFVHSFVPVIKDEKMVSALTSFDGKNIHASVKHNKIIGFQFHPEKSGEVGLDILKKSIEELNV